MNRIPINSYLLPVRALNRPKTRTAYVFVEARDISDSSRTGKLWSDLGTLALKAIVIVLSRSCCHLLRHGVSYPNFQRNGKLHPHDLYRGFIKVD